jgi:hypothetical protein
MINSDSLHGHNGPFTRLAVESAFQAIIPLQKSTRDVSRACGWAGGLESWKGQRGQGGRWEALLTPGEGVRGATPA